MRNFHARLPGLLLLATLAASHASAEPRRAAASTRLEHCGAETCLAVTGRRPDRAAPVLIAGHEVAVRGGRSWRASIPLAKVRLWSAPAARTIAVEAAGPGGGRVEAPLPIGLLGHVTELAFLDVGAGRRR
ncbi:hypothetical protein [uncultured Sphingomonas sp.]|uniref:hypothetical protein n=1 Tax=uncultured Sphingomonas sp. TaxID=158754 RepID=UPI0035CC5112